MEFAFAGNGQIMIRLDRNVGLVEKISWLGDTITKSLNSGMPENHGRWHRRKLRAISHTARFVVYEIPDEDPCTALFHLLDTMLDTWRYLEQFRIDSEGDCWKIRFHFSKDEKYLLGINGAEM